MADFLRVRNLDKEYDGRRALRDLSFTLDRGDFLSLFGPNGAGKSTLLRIIATLVAPSSGRVEIQGFDLREEPERFRMQLGVISHQSLLYDQMTARENLVFYASLYGVKEPAARANELLHTVGLYARRDSRVAGFSRGMRQRLSIARALVNDPSLLLLDEPFSGLDQYAATLLTEQLSSLRDRKRTIIMVTHNLDRGLESATRVGILAGGRLRYLAGSNDLDRAELAELYMDSIHGARVA